ncbi:hypothetical protein BDF20DRAFT_1004375 [Mycotypha africana]|uniref:uncharacterized protein n=1 Tax=Mycotypha africana TaxID=64632 RepID=UPI00230056B7|nr:uncharacterized protein BDF20DRAFT_1004375 [Mycotypha africana]KAI8968566.1 hypothetical protein BDF20DRAFT_1004375 [Mycotypha africana]
MMVWNVYVVEQEIEVTTPATDDQYQEQIRRVQAEQAYLVDTLADVHIEKKRFHYAIADLQKMHQQTRANAEIVDQIRIAVI